MLYEITYDYSQKVGGNYRTYERNSVGECNNQPVGYGPCGPLAHFGGDQIGRIFDMLRGQLATDNITLHVAPCGCRGRHND